MYYFVHAEQQMWLAAYSQRSTVTLAADAAASILSSSKENVTFSHNSRGARDYAPWLGKKLP